MNRVGRSGRPELVWTEEVVRKIASKHGVTIEEVQEAFEDAHALITRGRWGSRLVYGRTEAGRYLLVVTRPEGRWVLRLVTARDMMAHEKEWYRTK
jgi:uncharacterized DUF497 family protein